MCFYRIVCIGICIYVLVLVHVCIYLTETFSTLMVDVGMAAGYAASLSMGLDTDTKSLHIRGSVQTPPTVRGKRPLSLEILRERRLLYTEEITVALSDNVSSCRPVILFFC